MMTINLTIILCYMIFFIGLVFVDTDYKWVQKSWEVARKPKLETKIVDTMPAFMESKSSKLSKQGFVFNFHSMTRGTIPNNNFLTLKTPTNYKITNDSNDSISTQILPTLDYQAVYIYVFEGSVTVSLQMCEGSEMYGGRAHSKWNLVALDFPKLIKAGRCQNFSMEKDRPIISFHGSSEFTVWKTTQFCFFETRPTIRDYFTPRNVCIVVFIAAVISILCWWIDRNHKIEMSNRPIEKPIVDPEDAYFY
ncbi:hypothetical protein CRE_00103 [Caenorhabditis remanei]|uniref:Uncharacterized protein n=1 Tax=Caenorhabditis remanei TaxID=31234 RepID=E3LD61_CAERE|nr:hypothetical protein CRE_00103 [Caenorhabditis remanei]